MRINWPAVGVSSVLYWVLQAAWFTVFARQWQTGLGMAPEEIAANRAHPNFWPYVIALICNFVLAYVIARVLAMGERFNLFRGFRIGLLVGLVAGFALITELVFELRSHQFILISAACPLAGCALMGVVLGAWKPKGVVAQTMPAGPNGE